MTGFRALPKLLVGLCLGLLAGLATAADPAPDWRAAWSVSPSSVRNMNRFAASQTIRQIVRVSAAGNSLRLRFGQRYGLDTVQLTAVSVGLRAEGASIAPGSLRSVTFGGARSLNLAPGASISSDPVALPVAAFQDLVISVSGSGALGQVTEHYIARETAYISTAANAVDQLDASGFRRSPAGTPDAFFVLEAVDVRPATASRTLIAFGDSISDGYISALGSPFIQNTAGLGLNERYPDFLAQRLAQRFPGRYSVVNAGISGNRVTAAAFLPQYGPSLLDRLDDDVLAVPGISDVILLEGGNDLGFATRPNADALIAGLAQAVARLKTAGLRVLLGTLLPSRGAFNGALHGRPAVDTARQAVNNWIRNQQLADGIVDFDACIRDPARPGFLRPDLDSGDNLHPNAAGYQALAACVTLDLLD